MDKRETYQPNAARQSAHGTAVFGGMRHFQAFSQAWLRFFPAHKLSLRPPIQVTQTVGRLQISTYKKKSRIFKMKMKDFPFRFVFIVMISIIIFSCLIWLFIQSKNEVLHTLLAFGICLGVVWIVFLSILLLSFVSTAINERKDRIYQAQEPERLKQHQARFYCHICGKPSPKPYQYWDSYGENGQEWYSSYVTDYNKPTELVQCAKCQKWTCPSADPPHFENGVCKKCSENPPEQV